MNGHLTPVLLMKQKKVLIGLSFLLTELISKPYPGQGGFSVILFLRLK